MSDYKPPDQAARDEIVRERARNVVVEAGAGTGKTRTLVDRVIELVAPADPAARPLRLSRIAAITFTRKAAGELQLRLRQAILERLGAAPAGDPRHERLAAALGEVDVAFVGTIHGFADRLLRMRPVEAGISPVYEIVEQEDPVLSETTEFLLTASESGTLPEALSPVMASAGLDREDAEEAQRTIRDYVAAGLPAESKASGYQTVPGFDALVKGMVQQRDVPFPRPEVREPPVADVVAGLRGLLERIEKLTTGSPGTAWFKRFATRLERCIEDRSPIELFAALRRALVQTPRGFTKRDHFPGDEDGWALWKEFSQGDSKRDLAPLKSSLMAPMGKWFGRRLARLAPAVAAAYERVKSRLEVVDQADLLIKLRDLLQKNAGGIRAFYQGLFDHILVDEFQDTDPLQAEILFFLAEDGRSAARWTDVRLAPGRLTLVGDPKQSIYRFRRADIVTYACVCDLLRRQGALVRRLETNFRSRPALIGFFNDRLSELLGTAPAGGRVFDPARGAAYYEPLRAGPIPEARPAVHALPYDEPDGTTLKADRAREIEADMLSRYLVWLKRRAGIEIRDRETDAPRPLDYGDVAVLAETTTNLHKLFRALDRQGIPYAARGATLFLQEPVIRLFILGLRAVADESDGVAQSAFFSPPFFAVDWTDVVAGRLKGAESASPAVAEGAARAREVRETLRRLRRDRFAGAPSRTARRLMEETAFARTLALMPNGEQKLAAVREILFILDELVAREGLDFDGATARLRAWVENPVQMDPPAPVSGQAVMALTIHQAKGLEFPVVILWDGFASLAGRAGPVTWRVTRNGEWAIAMEGFETGSSGDGGLIDHEKVLAGEEKKRLYYVAATRARDLLVIPKPAGKGKRSAVLLGGAESDAVRVMDVFRPGSEPAWARHAKGTPAFPELKTADEKSERELMGRWKAARDVSARPIAVPVAVTALAHAGDKARDAAAAGAAAPLEATEEATDLSGEKAARRVASRFGPEFGETVHAALEAILRGSPARVEDVVRACAAAHGLADHVDEASGDVERAMKALRHAGVLDDRVRRYLEYPVAELDGEGRLITGYVDLVACFPDFLWVIDFKTDPPPAGPLEQSYPAYRKQVEIYKGMLAKGVQPGHPLRAALLFTANGRLVES